MLKKAGIIVAASVAGLLALTPLAFAADKHDADRGHDRDTHIDYSSTDLRYDESGRNCNAGVLNFGDVDATQRQGDRGLLGVLEVVNISPLSCNYNNDVNVDLGIIG